MAILYMYSCTGNVHIFLQSKEAPLVCNVFLGCNYIDTYVETLSETGRVHAYASSRISIGLLLALESNLFHPKKGMRDG
ncbi:hypothetical protein VNO78_19326 [Psophocarpus tetragonolobus]|uniref:Uncharacterized protein n=1 Tax=Psophocarpus tetragonolobus TaxID=3891 RepID=A0AAN9S7H1_PSOTE